MVRNYNITWERPVFGEVATHYLASPTDVIDELFKAQGLTFKNKGELEVFLRENGAVEKLTQSDLRNAASNTLVKDKDFEQAIKTKSFANWFYDELQKLESTGKANYKMPVLVRYGTNYVLLDNNHTYVLAYRYLKTASYWVVDMNALKPEEKVEAMVVEAGVIFVLGSHEPLFDVIKDLLITKQEARLNSASFVGSVNNWDKAMQECYRTLRKDHDIKTSYEMTKGKGASMKATAASKPIPPTSIHEKLNPTLWDENNDLRPEIRTQLLKIAQAFHESLDIPGKYEDVTFTGSMANFNYSDASDIDLHVIYNLSKIGPDAAMTAKMLVAKKALWAEKHDIVIKGIPVEVYPQSTSEVHKSTGVYSLIQNKWLVKPDIVRPQVDQKRIQQKAEQLAEQIDKVLRSKDVKQIQALQEKITKMRQAGLAKGGEFSEDNLVFKALRNSSNLEKLLTRKVTIQDEQLSLNVSKGSIILD